MRKIVVEKEVGSLTQFIDVLTSLEPIPCGGTERYFRGEQRGRVQ